MFWGNVGTEHVAMIKQCWVSLEADLIRVSPYPTLPGWPGIVDSIGERPRIRSCPVVIIELLDVMQKEYLNWRSLS